MVRRLTDFQRTTSSEVTMPGLTDNTDILTGVNQLIQAINDLVISSSCNCAPAVSFSCSCGTGGGSEGPSAGGTEGGAPPTGWEDVPGALPGSGPYNIRKCNVANATFDNIKLWIEQWKIYNVDTYSAALIIPLTSLIGFLAGELATPVPLIDGIAGLIVGFLIGIAIAVVGGGFDLDNILSIMDTYHQELVCALFEATSTQQAQDDFITVLQENGASAGDILLLRAVLTVDLLNFLFFTRDPIIETALSEDYNPPLPCNCLGCNWSLGQNGTLVSGSLAAGTAGFTIATEDAGSGYHSFYLVYCPTECSEISHSVTVGSFTSGVDTFYNYIRCSDGDWEISGVYTPETICVRGRDSDSLAVQIISLSPLEMTFVVEGACIS
jgi:hypothetical protein